MCLLWNEVPQFVRQYNHSITQNYYLNSSHTKLCFLFALRLIILWRKIIHSNSGTMEILLWVEQTKLRSFLLLPWLSQSLWNFISNNCLTHKQNSEVVLTNTQLVHSINYRVTQIILKITRNGISCSPISANNTYKAMYQGYRTFSKTHKRISQVFPLQHIFNYYAVC